MSAVARHTAVVASTSYKTSAIIHVRSKTGPLSAKFTSLVAKSKAVAGNVQPGQPVKVRIYETNNPAAAAGTGTLLVPEFDVLPGAQVVKSLVTNKFIRIETKGASADYKGGQSLNIDCMFDGLPFHGQVDIEIHDGKTGFGYFGYPNQVGGADYDNAAWPEVPSEAS